MDTISKPQHYLGRGGIEPLSFIVSNKMSFAEGCVVKYITRYPLKGTPEEDLKKAMYYLQTLLDEVREDAKDDAKDDA